MKDFVERFNQLQQKEIKKMSCKDCNFGEFDEENGIFYSNTGDTLAYLIDIKKHIVDDTITINNYHASFQIYPVGDKMTILKLINITTFINSAKLENFDSLQLHNDMLHKYPYPVRNYTITKADTTEINQLQQKALKEFEKRVIEKLK